MKVSEILERVGYVEIRLEGPFSIKDTEEVVRESAAATSRKDGSRILVNFRGVSGGPVTTLERYQMAMEAVRVLPKGVRTAVLNRPEMIDPEKFGVRVAQNRGLPIEVFDDEGQAIAWLTQDDGKSLETKKEPT